MTKSKVYSSETLAWLEWELDKFIEPNKTLVPQDFLVYTDAKGRTTIRFTDYIEYAGKEVNDTDTYSNADQDPITDFNNVNSMIEEIEDKIIYPKKFEMINLNKNELLELEENMYIKKQLKEEE